MIIKGIKKFFSKRNSMGNENKFELILQYVCDVYGENDLSVRLTEKLTDMFIKEHPFATILELEDKKITFVSWEVYYKYSELLKECICNCKTYEIEIHATVIEKAIMSVIEKLGLEVLKKDYEYKNTYLVLKIKKDEKLKIFEHVLRDIKNIENGSSPIWKRIDEWLNERIEYWKDRTLGQ